MTIQVGYLAFRYFAFISYDFRDAEWGKRLQQKLE